MKHLISFGLGALITTLIVLFALPSNKKFQSELDRLHAQNDSLYKAIDSTTVKIKQLDSMACVLTIIVNEDKKKLGSLNKKANEYKEKYNEEHNRIITMSNAVAAREFANAFK